MPYSPSVYLFSGYQPRPQAAPAPGRALAVLLAVVAVLGVWALLPGWYQAGSLDHNAYRWLAGTLFRWPALLLGLLLANAVVWRWATWPMACCSQPGDARRALVLILALGFHVLWLLLAAGAAVLALLGFLERWPLPA